VLYTKVTAQCDKLVMVVGRPMLTVLAAVDVPWQNVSKSGVWDKIREGSALIFADTQIPLQHSIG